MYPKENICVVNKNFIMRVFHKTLTSIDKFSELKVLNLKASSTENLIKEKYNNLQKCTSNTLRIEGHIPVLLDAGKRYLGEKKLRKPIHKMF